MIGVSIVETSVGARGENGITQMEQTMTSCTPRGLLSVVIVVATAAISMAQISVVGQLQPSLTANYGDIWGDGDYAYLGTLGNEGVFIIDIADPTAPAVASQYFPSQGSRPQDIKVHNGIGYFAMDGGGGVEVVDLSDPANPAFLSNLNIGGIHNIFVTDDWLFTTSAGSTVRVYDATDPTDLQFVRQIVTGGTTHDMTVVGDRLYTSSFSQGTRVFDITDMSVDTPPVQLGLVSSGANSHSSWATDDGNVLVSAREIGNGEVTLFDISDPQNPSVLSQIFDSDFGAIAFSPHNPIIDGDTLYVSWYEAGLQVFDIADPANPVHLGGFDTSVNLGVYPFLGTDRILLSDIATGLTIVDVSSVVELLGDFDGDGSYACSDIDLLVEQLAMGSDDLTFDMTGDGELNSADLEAWLAVAGAANLDSGDAYLEGDANLDGTVNGLDFVIWSENRFSPTAAWCGGDFNADGVVDGLDFVRWNANKFASTQSVPEPSVCVLLLAFFASCAVRRRPGTP